MFTDLRTLPAPSRLTAEVAVIGAGAAGISMARELAAAGRRVALLESGGLQRDEATQALYRGKSLGEPYWALDWARLRFFGGTTNHWTGWCRPLDEVDFEPRAHIPGSGWPLSLTELAPYYDRAHAICDLGDNDYDPRRWSERLGLPLLEPPGGEIRSAIWQLSRPTRFAEKYRSELESSADVMAYLYGNAVELEATGDERRVTRARVRVLGGDDHWLEAEHFVLALGGMENTRLLLSCAENRSTCFGSSSGRLGRYFADHPHSDVGYLLTPLGDDRLRLYKGNVAVGKPTAVRASLVVAPEAQRREKLLGASVLFEPPEKPPQLAPDAMAGIRALMGVPRDGDCRILAVKVRSEHWLDAESKLTLSHERDALGMKRLALSWRHDEKMKASVRRTLEFVAGALGRADLGRLYSHAHSSRATKGAWPEIAGGAHHMGTTRMSADPSRGVVDRNCRVHGMENLYVAGSSVFSTGGYANPTLTIVALALRLADHLRRT